ncbi:MAG TPA: dihydroxy-acid dehydratase [Prosthecobacter sp.]|nr:dihydroxy-acid dehydratase [Prosthecobacter sp.]HRK14732.1 dihydroxy-acid dehydratase [Prosthecobacter sp.]
MATPLNWNSSSLTRGWQRGVNAFFWGLGFKPEDFDKAQIGIGTPLLDGNICNIHAHELARLIKQGCDEAGLIGFPFGVSPVSDNITQGNIGGAASLCSRNLMANGAEMVCTSHCYDALIGLHHCDKNGPAFAMALARTNYPGLIVNGGSIMPGCHDGRPTSILDVYDAAAREKQGTMSYEESEQIIRTACPGAGGCGIAASFNTWGIALEAMGLSLPDTSSIPAIDSAKRAECLRVGRAVRLLLERGIRPRDIITKASLSNAMTAIAAAGGSTNGVLHILAVAREAGVDFTLRDVQAICRRTPVLCNFAPRGRGTMNDLHRLGGTTMFLKHLHGTGLLDGSCLTVTGATLAENLAGAPPVPFPNELIAPLDTPFKAYADIQICFGNISPHGMVFKVSSLDEPCFTGTAICFTDSKGVSDAAAAGRIRPGHIVVIRGCGPVALGMPEMHVASAALAVPELYGKVALLSDTRVSGVSGGAVGVHCSPEAAVGGPIARVRDGDEIEFDLLAGTIEVKADLDARGGGAPPGPPRHPFGYLADFAATVTQAHEGCVPAWVLQKRQ